MITMMLVITAMGCSDGFVDAIHAGFDKDFAKSDKASWLVSGTMEIVADDNKSKTVAYASWLDGKGKINIAFSAVIGDKQVDAFTRFARKDIEENGWQCSTTYFINSGDRDKPFWVQADKMAYTWIIMSAKDLEDALKLLKEHGVVKKPR